MYPGEPGGSHCEQQGGPCAWGCHHHTATLMPAEVRSLQPQPVRWLLRAPLNPNPALALPTLPLP